MIRNLPGWAPIRLKRIGKDRLWLPGVALLLLLFLAIGSWLRPDPSAVPLISLGSQSFLVLALLAFVGGIISFVSPCTLPILPAYFAFASQSGRSRIALNTIAFMLGVATMFSLLGASASALGRILLQNQQLLLLIGGAVVMGFGVMSLLGKGFGGMTRKATASPGSTIGGSFTFGLTFSVGWSSCVGPILGVVLTLAASTGSVMRGMMLLFIYALGLGLPLTLVSTFFGRASRKSLFWRLLKGKGWTWHTHAAVVGLVWALAIWRVLVALAEYLFRQMDSLSGQAFTASHEFGLLFIVIAAALLWVFTNPREKRAALHLHSTQAFSGLLFVAMAILMLNGSLATFNALIPPDLAIWFAGLEEGLVLFFS